MSVQRDFKDRLFRFIFGREERKENTLELYNALNGTNYTDPDLLELTTVEDAIYLGMKNDLSFIIDGLISLYEHQSTWNPNMPVRILVYFGKQYEKYIAANDLNRFGTKLMKLPTPKCVVFYNGAKDIPPRMELNLTDAFEFPEKSDINVRVQVININHDSGEKLLELCRPLREYSTFIGYVDDNRDAGMDTETAIDVAIDACIREGILADLLRKHRAEVKDMLLTEYNEEEIYRLMKRDAREEGLEEGRAEGLAEGRAEGRAEGIAEGRAEGLAEGRAEGLAEGRAKARIELLSALVEEGVLTLEKAAEKVGLSPEEFLQKAEDLCQNGE